MTNLADISRINLAYQLKDGQKIYIPSIHDDEELPTIQNDAGNNILIPDTPTTSNLININTASQLELESLSGIGTSTATKIIEYRNKNGDFQQIEDIMKVNGIGEAKFDLIKDYICV